jgi:hypothetical protein
MQRNEMKSHWSGARLARPVRNEHFHVWRRPDDNLIDSVQIVIENRLVSPFNGKEIHVCTHVILYHWSAQSDCTV